jgi:predicted RNase H-like HicB family nuclease
MAKQTIHGVVFKDAESDQWAAPRFEYQVGTQGDNAEHARAMLKEAVELHLEDMTAEDYETFFQEIDGEPNLVELTVDAATLLHA